MADSHFTHGNATRSVHGDIERRREQPYHALTTPIVQTATYTFADSADLCAYQDAKLWGNGNGRVEYGRYGNPTIRAVEQRLANLEGGGDALLTASGMAALSGTLLSILPTGSHIIFSDDCYRKTRQFCYSFLQRLGIEFTEVALGDYDALAAAVQTNTRLIISETPTNPYLRVCDLEQLVAIARRHKHIKTIIDATFATPINLRPLDYGVDLVIHSATKYFSGHNDLLAGVVVGETGLIHALRQAQGMLGATVDPHAAYLLERGLKTLALRVQQQNSTALQLAHYLEQHPAVARVWYPGLPSHPDHAVAARQMHGFGGVISFEVEPQPGQSPLQAGSTVVDRLRIPIIAPSLGGVESLVEQPSLMSYYELSQTERLALGIKDNLIRFACGIEDADDLLADFEQALAAQSRIQQVRAAAAV